MEGSGGGAANGGAGGGGGEPARVPSTVGGRQRFEVQLRPGETTIVSWKKLVKDASKANKQISDPEPPPIVHPAIEARIAPGSPAEDEANDAPPSSRFSAVIEKIERLYMGKNSSDEEDLNDVPDDDEYDTEDSFIDDTELDEYFQVDNSAIKHDGFFVNRGKLERTTNEPTLSPNQQPKKRRRKDLTKGPAEDGNVPNKLVKVGKKTARMSVPSIGNNSMSLSHVVALPSVHRSEDMKLKNLANTSEISAKKNSVESKTTLDPSPLRVSNGGGTVEEKDIDKHKTKTHENKLKDASVCTNTSNQRSSEKNSIGQSKSQPGGLMNNADELDQLAQPREKNSVRERSDINAPEGKNSMQTAKAPLMHRKEGSSVKQKGSMLEKAIRELEKIVAESRPPSMEVSDADISSQAVKKRMPPEIKQKLAKVARLAQASHGKISKELLNRLMSIVGHLIQLRTLKRNLKIMVNMGLSAKQEKDARFQQIKKEVDEMVKVRVPFMKSKAIEQQAGSSDDFQETGAEEKEIFKRKFSIDDALEDRICDLYDLYVEGLDEDAAPQVRKLYAELAELWPKGFMDNHGIKRAICRAKDRKRALYTRHKNEEKIKRKKSLLAKAEEPVRADTTSVPQSQHVQDKSVTDAGNHNKPAPNPTAAANPVAHIPNATTNGPNLDWPKQDKAAKAISANPNDTVKTTAEVLVKKKIKRKPESDLAEAHANTRPEKLTAVQGEEKHKTHKQVVGPTHKSNNLQPTVSSSVTANATVVAVQPPPPLPSSENLN